RMALSEQQIQVTAPAAGWTFHQLNVIRTKDYRAENPEKFRKLANGAGINTQIAFFRGPVELYLVILSMMRFAADEKTALPMPNHLPAAHSAKGPERGEQVNGFEDVRFALSVVPQQQVQARAELDIESSVIAKVAQPELAQMHGRSVSKKGRFWKKE